MQCALLESRACCITKCMLDKEHYIPYSRAEVVELVRKDLPVELHEKYSTFVRLLLAWYHYTFHENLEHLKASFELATVQTTQTSLQCPPPAQLFEKELDAVVRAANFNPISEQDLNAALTEESVFKVRLHVDFSEFEKVIFYRRGKSQRLADVDRWFGLSRQQIQFTNYDHVLVYVRYKNLRSELSSNAEFDNPIILKLFKNIPQADLEMLFPNTQVRMRLTDKIFIGVPAFLSGLVVLTTKIGASLLLLGGLAAYWLGFQKQAVIVDQATLLALFSSAFALGAYLFKQFSNFKNRKIRFMKVLAENLYFKNLDNDAGVLTNIVDYAEESECKEILLVYGELLAHGPKSSDQLQLSINARLEQKTNFEINDAIKKLTELDLCRVDKNLYEAVSLTEALDSLDQRWDKLFSI